MSRCPHCGAVVLPHAAGCVLREPQRDLVAAAEPENLVVAVQPSLFGDSRILYLRNPSTREIAHIPVKVAGI